MKTHANQNDLFASPIVAPAEPAEPAGPAQLDVEVYCAAKAAKSSGDGSVGG